MAKKSLQWYIDYYTRNFPSNSKETVKALAQRSFDLQPGGTPTPKPTVSPKAGPIVGRNPTPKPTTTPTAAPGAIPAGLGVSIAQAAANTRLNITPPKDVNIQTIDFVTSLTKAQVGQITPWLKKFGASKTDISTVGNAKKFLQNNYPTYIENSKGSLTRLIQFFKDDYLPSSDSSAAAKTQSNGVTQYITKQAPELVAKDVDKFLLSTIGSKNINKESRDKIMVEINKMIAAGTTTTSKMDKAGKTTVTQTPGYSEERAGEIVSRLAKQGEPEKYEQQRQLNFFDFMQQAEQMRGGR